MRWLYERWPFFALAAVGIWLLFSRVLEVWTIPSDDRFLAASIVPTLRAGDRVVLLRRGTPSYGDVVRCPHPEDSAKPVLGRVFGMAGDTVQVDFATVRIDGKAVASTSSCGVVTVQDPNIDESIELACDREEGGGALHERVRSATRPRLGGPPTQVPAEQLYLVSDDRQFSYDSRDFGTLPTESCRPLVLRLWSEDGWLDGEHRFTYIR